MTQKIKISMCDGVKVVVPDSLNLITPYVLYEQEDWFEDEIKFLRRLLKPGQKVIDIGANYGVYALSMAKSVGIDGTVWAFEPASRTADFLMESISENLFENVILERAAISSESGYAQLSLNIQSELNSISKAESIITDFEKVKMYTLDDCMERNSWENISFLKIDAEGEESNILIGAQRFLTSNSPLIQYEIKAGFQLQLDLISEFAKYGYETYKLVPGIAVLIPFDSSEKIDDYQLNLFCCKKDRKDILINDGFLIDVYLNKINVQDNFHSFINSVSLDYRHSLNCVNDKIPYVNRHFERWMKNENTDIFKLYAISCDENLKSIDRFKALQLGFAMLLNFHDSEVNVFQLGNLARISIDIGARSIAVDSLRKLIGILMTEIELNPIEPFLVPSRRFESIDYLDNFKNWYLASALDALEMSQAFSSFYTGNDSRNLLEFIIQLGYGSPEIIRRLNLLKLRFG